MTYLHHTTKRPDGTAQYEITATNGARQIPISSLVGNLFSGLRNPIETKTGKKVANVTLAAHYKDNADATLIGTILEGVKYVCEANGLPMPKWEEFIPVDIAFWGDEIEAVANDLATGDYIAPLGDIKIYVYSYTTKEGKTAKKLTVHFSQSAAYMKGQPKYRMISRSKKHSIMVANEFDVVNKKFRIA